MELPKTRLSSLTKEGKSEYYKHWALREKTGVAKKLDLALKEIEPEVRADKRKLELELKFLASAFAVDYKQLLIYYNKNESTDSNF